MTQSFASDPAVTEALKGLQKIIESQSTFESDLEADHNEADNILCELLIVLGHVEVVRAFRKIRKWYV